MSRKPKKEPLPKVGDRKQVGWLPRDVKMGWHKDKPKGTLLLGWDLTTDTRQLWRTLGTGPDAEAEFLGFVVHKHPTY